MPSANPLRRTVQLLLVGRRLRPRLESEARRRDQRVPRFDELGFLLQRQTNSPATPPG